MRTTEHEVAAARRLAEAVVQFLVAYEDGAARRQARRPAEEITVHLEQPPALKSPGPQLPQTEQPRLPDRLLVTTREAAKLLSVGERKLWEITKPRGPIPAVRIGRLVRYPVEELAKVIAKSRPHCRISD